MARARESTWPAARWSISAATTCAPRPTARPRERPPELSQDEAALLAAIGDDPTHIDAITDRCGLPPHTVASLLMVLEIKKVVTQLPGKHFARR
jgi:predicted Rossmann fold nucleotide-binding protein DprA/Smf involved in DNA uptake